MLARYKRIVTCVRLQITQRKQTAGRMAPTSITKHLRTGDDLPALKPGVLRLYSMKFCPFADRARLVLLAKGIDHEVVNVNTWNKPTWFAEKNPLQLVPVVEEGDKIVYESLIVAKYLDELYPDKNPLIPKDLYQRARDDIVIAYFEGKVVPALFRKEEEVFTKGLAYLEEELKKRGTDYFYGSKPGFVDYVFWPIFARLSASDLLGRGNQVPASYELLVAWVARMRNDKAVKSIIHPDSAYQEFSKHYRTDNTLFDEIKTPN